MRRVLIAAGGTGGHIYPGLAIAEALKKSDPQVEIIFAGSYVGLEKTIVPQYGYEMVFIHALGFEKGFSWGTIKAFHSIFQSRRDVTRILKKLKPDLVIGTGGFTCAALLMEAAKRGIPTMIHEQNSYPGRANRLLGRYVDRVAISFKEAGSFFPKNKIVFTGNPVRESFKNRNHEEDKRRLGIDSDRIMILAMGGSQGAESINRSMLDYIAMSKSEKMIFYLLTGRESHEDILKEAERKGININDQNIRIEAFSREMHILLNAADLVISRSGATSIAEIAAVGVPAIFIPYPYAANDHQTANARAIVDLGGAVMVQDDLLNSKILQETIDGLLRSPHQLEEMRKAVKKFGVSDSEHVIAEVAVNLMNQKCK